MNVAGTAAIAHTSSSTATWATMADIRMDGESTAAVSVAAVGFHHGQCQWRSLAIQRGHSRGHVHPIQLHILIVQVERLSCCCCRGLEIVIVRDIVLWLVLVVVDLVVEWLLELMVLILLLMLAQQYVVFAS